MRFVRLMVTFNLPSGTIIIICYTACKIWIIINNNSCVADGILSYSMPQGDKRDPDWEFYDSTYDGYWDGELQRGLGQLTDGKVGPDNFRMAYYDTERGKRFLNYVFIH